jgi:hypothetical protein
MKKLMIVVSLISQVLMAQDPVNEFTSTSQEFDSGKLTNALFLVAKSSQLGQEIAETTEKKGRKVYPYIVGTLGNARYGIPGSEHAHMMTIGYLGVGVEVGKAFIEFKASRGSGGPAEGENATYEENGITEGGALSQFAYEVQAGYQVYERGKFAILPTVIWEKMSNGKTRVPVGENLEIFSGGIASNVEYVDFILERPEFLGAGFRLDWSLVEDNNEGRVKGAKAFLDMVYGERTQPIQYYDPYAEVEGTAAIAPILPPEGYEGSEFKDSYLVIQGGVRVKF